MPGGPGRAPGELPAEVAFNSLRAHEAAQFCLSIPELISRCFVRIIWKQFLFQSAVHR